MREFFRDWKRKAAVVALLAVVGFYLANEIPLQKYGSFINRKYAKEITILEASATAPISVDEGLGQPAEQLRNRLGDSFDGHVFYSVNGSLDGHHGARTFKPMPEYSIVSTYCGARIDARHKIYFAESSSGTRLLHYRVSLPDAPSFKHMSIFFVRDTVDEEMKAMKSQRILE